MVKKIITVALISGLCAVLVGLATMYSRSETLRNVRAIDGKLIARLVSATVVAGKGEDFSGELQGAFEALGNSRSGVKLGVALYRNNELFVTNYAVQSTDLAGANTGDTPRRNRTSVENVALDNGWSLVLYRPENRFSYGEVYDFLHTPIEQLISDDDRDVTWNTVFHKAGPPMTIAFLITLTIGVALQLFLERKERELARMRMRLQKSDLQLEETHNEKRQLVEARERLQAELRNLECRRGESEELREMAFRDIDDLKGKRDGLEERLRQYDDQIREKDDYIAKVQGENGNLRKRVQDLEKTQEESDKRESAISEKQIEILKKMWPKHEWHPKALKETIEWYVRANDENKREHLTQLLGSCTNSHARWQKMAYVDDKLLHNEGTERVKLYWEKMNNGLPRVIKVCGRGNEHEKPDKELLTRLKTVRLQRG